jgi:hypothetical protein
MLLEIIALLSADFEAECNVFYCDGKAIRDATTSSCSLKVSAIFYVAIVVPKERPINLRAADPLG